MRKLITAAIVGLALAGLTGCVSPSTQVADPGVMEFGSGWFIASSDTDAPGSGPSMPVYSASGNDFAHQNKLGYVFNQISSASWIDPNAPLWAPQIYNVGGKTVAYFAARNKFTSHRCIGMAIASSGVTNFADTGNPFCSPTGKDLIDPALFVNGSSKYLLYKRDDPANRAINITTAGSDGLHPDANGGTQLLSVTAPWEKVGTYSSVEAPTLVKHGSYFYLFYSGARYNSTKYGIGVARCPVSSGPVCNYNSDKLGGSSATSAPLLTGYGQYCGVGHQDVTNNASIIWFHSYTSGSTSGNCDTSGKRFLGADGLDWYGSWPSVQSSGPGL
jgi:arabinan endo-1,5-alpha-L-arabinosidase